MALAYEPPVGLDVLPPGGLSFPWREVSGGDLIALGYWFRRPHLNLECLGVDDASEINNGWHDISDTSTSA